MSLKELNLKKSYDSDKDNTLEDFYIPILSESIEYRRLAGFFSSTSLAVAAKGMADFIRNGGSMKLIVSAKFQKEDLNAIKEIYKNQEELIEKIIIKDLENLENEFVKDHVRALSWMILNKKLKIKIAIVYNNEEMPIEANKIEQLGIFHQKIGILKDSEGNIISFSGSDNESASGWVSNIEEFKVFCNWNFSEQEYLRADISKFERFWTDSAKRTKVIDIPAAVKNKLIELSPKSIEELNLEKWHKLKTKKKVNKIIVWEHQQKAIDNWFSNNKRGIFEMATGTGKTFTALGCLKKILKEEDKLVTIISCPYDHLIKQWIGDLNEFGIDIDYIVADSSNYKWKYELTDKIYDILNGISNKIIIFTTHTTFSSNNFINLMRKINVKILLIADEVHGIGSKERKKGLIDIYNFRLGLSATPRRWFDDDGTEKIFDFFEKSVFEFSLKEAITTINPSTGKTYLTPYRYKPYFIDLTAEEFLEYEMESIKIAKMYHVSKNKEKKEKLLTLLFEKRQRIIRNAINKLTVFKEILNNIKTIKNCLIYCSPQQINNVQDILNNYKNQNIIQSRFTMETGTTLQKEFGNLSERGYLLKNFSDGTIDALVAMNILDEGINIPSAKIAIILASTGNPRQYIQRRGRILRRFSNKDIATIYDIMVIPSLPKDTSTNLIELEKKILKKELIRYKEFADAANNKLECFNKIHEIEEKYHIFV